MKTLTYFITRKTASNDLLTQFESVLAKFFADENQPELSTVNSLASSLNVSPNYLSDMLRSLTGQNAQQHIHNKLIENAKEILTT
ncbi:MAG: AraC family transcriptional regulator, partial [Ginsengibacter sp.]